MTHDRSAIACATGGCKGVFLHGVLSAFEVSGYRAGAYAAASSSVLPTAAAAVGRINDLGLDYWYKGQEILQQPGAGMSEVILGGLDQTLPGLLPHLFGKEAPRFLIVASLVDPEAAQETQGKGARRRGRKLLLEAARGDRSWVDTYLTARLFDTESEDENFRLTAENFAQVAYASSRMLHAWDIPAWVGDRPFVDAYYTCACPAMDMAERGYETVIAVANEPVLYRDIFQSEIIPDQWHGVAIQIIRPDFDPAEIGVSYTTADTQGLKKVYAHGIKMGNIFLQQVGWK